ncbi:MAG: 2-phospho-L-lactate transferase CofD family protein, partial [Nitriliruptorales bacterium]|nr:2-phospho-L-lactate transferase CofD family protein [Nitriliruptorales bacterium]
HFQEYWVRERAEPAVARVEVRGNDAAVPSAAVRDALRDADAIVLAPSNPVVSIGPILALEGVRPSLVDSSAPVVGISPIVGGEVVRGMADRLLPAQGIAVSAAGVAAGYADLLDGWVIDNADKATAGAIRSELDLEVTVTDTIMDDPEVAADLARTALELAGYRT